MRHPDNRRGNEKRERMAEMTGAAGRRISGFVTGASMTIDGGYVA